MYKLSRRFLLASALVPPFVCGLGAPFGPRSLAGDIVSHYTATYVLARQAGFTHRQARSIAAGDWSMDLNAGTTALPLVDFAGDISGDLGHIKSAGLGWSTTAQWQDRGAAYHSLGNQASVVNALNGLRNDVLTSAASSDDKLIQLGEYLHATQDSYFHQKDGEPFSETTGHLLYGHDTDRVGTHFDAALTSNEATYDILKQYHDNATLPDVRPANQIYSSDTQQEIQSIKNNDNVTGIFRLTSAEANAYKVTQQLGGE
jgi:hypothetical protein